jgi:hypothetical protein
LSLHFSVSSLLDRQLYTVFIFHKWPMFIAVSSFHRRFMHKAINSRRHSGKHYSQNTSMCMLHVFVYRTWIQLWIKIIRCKLKTIVRHHSLSVLESGFVNKWEYLHLFLQGANLHVSVKALMYKQVLQKTE